MRPDRLNRKRGPFVVEALERRELMASRVANLDPLPHQQRLVDPANRPSLVSITERLAAERASLQNSSPEKKPKVDDKVTVKRLRVVVYGVLVPASLVTDGKSRGAAIISADIVWLLDLTAVKGFDVYAQQLLQKPVVATGSGEISKNAKGEIKRKFSVNWIEPLMETNIAPAVIGRHAEIAAGLGRPPASPRLPGKP